MAVNYPGMRLTNSLPAGTNNIGDVDVVSMPTQTDTPLLILAYGEITISTPGNEIQIYTGGVTKAFLIRALPSNTGEVYIGASDITSNNGMILESGDTMMLPVNNDDLAIYFDVETAGEGIRVTVFG